MSLFAIADTHLSLSADKPMDSFPGWNNYVSRLEKNWNAVVDDKDTVVIAGDISWAMNFEELTADFDFINNLKGNKIIIKGNHDYWWSTYKKMNEFIEKNGFSTIKILSNNSYDVAGVSVCGSRGWMIESSDSHDEKILSREVARLKMSLDSADNSEKIVFLHYPPVTNTSQCNEILSLLDEYGIKKCFYGHLHGEASRFAYEGVINSTNYTLISADRLSFVPKLIFTF